MTSKEYFKLCADKRELEIEAKAVAQEYADIMERGDIVQYLDEMSDFDEDGVQLEGDEHGAYQHTDTHCLTIPADFIFDPEARVRLRKEEEAKKRKAEKDAKRRKEIEAKASKDRRRQAFESLREEFGKEKTV